MLIFRIFVNFKLHKTRLPNTYTIAQDVFTPLFFVFLLVFVLLENYLGPGYERSKDECSPFCRRCWPLIEAFSVNDATK